LLYKRYKKEKEKEKVKEKVKEKENTIIIFLSFLNF
jgi:hypothetical protein